MELNEPFEGHEHATTSLKVVLLVFALVLVGALAYLVQATYSQTEETTEVAPNVKEKTEEVTSVDETSESSDLTAVTSTVDVSTWTTWTRSEQHGGKINYLVKAPKNWGFWGADAGGLTLVELTDESFTQDMYLGGKSKTAYTHTYLAFASSTKSYSDWVTAGGNATTAPSVTGKKEVTIDGHKATYQIENGTTTAYYLDMTDIYTGTFLKIYFTSNDKYAKDIEAVVASLKFKPTAAELTAAKQIP